MHPYTLNLANPRRLRADLGFEHDPAALESGEGPPGGDQARHPTAVTASTVPGPGVYADLADEHVDRGHQVGVQLIDPYPAHPRIDGDTRA